MAWRLPAAAVVGFALGSGVPLSSVRGALDAVGVKVDDGSGAGQVFRRLEELKDSTTTAVTPAPPRVPQTTTSSSSSSALDAHPAARFGVPEAPTVIKVHDAYVCAYDRRMRTPAWSLEVLTKQSLESAPPEVHRKHAQFVEDQSEPPAFRARLADYRGSGFDRGHLVPAADAKQTQRALNQTFTLSNIAPQVGAGFNRDYWARLEALCRDVARRSAETRLFVVSGPLWMPADDGRGGRARVTYDVLGSPPNVAVPTHFFKVLLLEHSNGTVAEAAFVLPNAAIADDTPLTAFAMPVDAVERASGLRFWPRLAGARRRALCSGGACALPAPYEQRKRLPSGAKKKGG